MKIALPVAFCAVVGVSTIVAAAESAKNQEAIDEVLAGRCQVAGRLVGIPTGRVDQGFAGCDQLRRQKGDRRKDERAVDRRPDSAGQQPGARR